MFSLRRFASTFCCTAAVVLATPIPLTQFNLPLMEDFNALAIVGSSVLPNGWMFSESGTSANTAYGAGTGSSATGNTYSFGPSATSERAFGTLRTAGVISTLGVAFINQTGAMITELAFQYRGEQWRLGATGRMDRLDFAYSFDATSLALGTWLNLDELDFSSPSTTGTIGARDGNALANQAVLASTVSGLFIAPGSTFWFRWTDFDSLNADDGLAIDDFSIEAIQAIQPIEPPSPVANSVPDRLPLGAFAAVVAALFVFGQREMRLVRV